MIRCSSASKPMKAAPPGSRAVRGPSQRVCAAAGANREVEAKLKAWHKTDECSQRLIKIPGVPIGAAPPKMKPRRPSSSERAAVRGLDRLDAAGSFHRRKVRHGVITRADDKLCAPC